MDAYPPEMLSDYGQFGAMLLVDLRGVLNRRLNTPSSPLPNHSPVASRFLARLRL